MPILGHLLLALASVLNILFQLAVVLFIGRAVMSWIQADPRQSLVRLFYDLSEPVLGPIRRLVPPIGAVDLSPLIAILIIIFLRHFLVPSLRYAGYQLI
ncbi:MAG: YggT family protein [Candidatus Zixiibacteriota bacterium]|nr:MAG: YggT family protein [candidate division Zixibacteria bacterium]